MRLIAAVNALRSSGLREVMGHAVDRDFFRSTQIAPAFLRSVRTDGHEVMVLPLTALATINEHTEPLADHARIWLPARPIDVDEVLTSGSGTTGK